MAVEIRQGQCGHQPVRAAWAGQPAPDAAGVIPIVVPPGPVAAWTSPPFEADHSRRVSVWAREAADMKSSVAAFVIALEDFLAAQSGHPGMISLLLTSDEKRGVMAIDGVACHGALAGTSVGLLPDACLVGRTLKPGAPGRQCTYRSAREHSGAACVSHGRQGAHGLC